MSILKVMLKKKDIMMMIILRVKRRHGHEEPTLFKTDATEFGLIFISSGDLGER